ncbi:lipopolysaccharide biosynthesis protein [Weissella confusa]|uniref:lipopolysaccharide biosynthesis protein n=1 Tax=Weissella confusa TaxID=1583 RepID=UPI0018F16E49|nr:oligosaccharide flippase family protein [Weissella confusa]MBJ7671164.1 oligosaccharide flippase family protein [Weissella confusa]
MSKGTKLLKNTGIFAFGSLGSKVISFLMVPLYTYTLSTADYGKVDLVLTTVNLFLPIVSLSLFDAAFRFVMDDENDNAEILKTALVSIAALSLIFLPVVLSVGHMMSIDSLYWFWAILSLSAVFNLMQNYIRAMGYSKLFSVNGMINTLIFALLNLIFLLLLKWGLNGYFLSYVLSLSVTVAIPMVAIDARRILNTSKYSVALLKKMMRYSLPLIPNSLSWWLTNDVSRYFILVFVGVTGNGLFAVANKIPAIVSIIFNVIVQAWQISVIEELGSDDAGSFFSDVIDRLVIVSFTIQTLLLLSIKIIFPLIVSPDYQSAWEYVPLMMLAVTMSNLSAFLGAVYVATKKTSALFVTTIVGTAINVTLALGLTRCWGINGTAVAAVVAFFAVFFLRLNHIQKFINLNVNTAMLITYTLLYLMAAVLLINMWWWAAVATSVVLLSVLGYSFVYKNKFKK